MRLWLDSGLDRMANAGCTRLASVAVGQFRRSASLEGRMSDETPRYACAPKHPAEATQSGIEYFVAADEDYALLHFLIDTILASDHDGFATIQILNGVPDEQIPSPSEFAAKTPGPRTRFLRRKSQLLIEMFMARLVDGFQSYLVDLIRAVLKARPEILTSRQPSVSLEDVLQHKTIEDLLQSVIERRVGSLSYEGFAALERWCFERGLEIMVSETQRTALIELIATRNIIAHNRGRVDERYTKAAGATRFALGDRRKLNGEDYTDAILLLHGVVTATDSAAAAKFGLSTSSVAIRTSAQTIRAQNPQ